MSSWWNRQKAFDAGTDFLQTGKVDSFDRLGYGYQGDNSALGGGFGGGQGGVCYSSADCGSGYGCFNNKCQKDGGSLEGCSGLRVISCNGTSSCSGEDDCGSSGSSGCSSPNCGGGGGGRGGGGPEECCGARCCRFGGFGVQCYCGPCPPPQRCQKYCDAFYKVNYRQAEGCGNPTTCSECEVCQKVQAFWTECVPAQRGSGAPCWCENNECYQCESCGEDGTCSPDCSTCQTCTIMYNQTCPCGGEVSVKCCNSSCIGAPSYADCLKAACGEVESDCDPDEDPCAGNCKTVTTYDGDPPPPCPEGQVCKTSGNISVGGRTATLTEQCDYSGLPESCLHCDCNCNNDCGDCEICNAACECVPDPRCDSLSP